MRNYPLALYGHPALNIVATPVEQSEFGSPDLVDLVVDMFHTMYMANGVGLAAPQIAITRRVAVVDTSAGKHPETKLVLINPEIISRHGHQETQEGCLSLPGVSAICPRSQEVTVRAWTVNGEERVIEANGLLAQAIQHEVDHLDGRLYVWHLSSLKRKLILDRFRNYTRHQLDVDDLALENI